MLQLDVTDPASQCALATRLKGTPVDLLICNAGVNLDKGQKLESGYPSAMWEATFAANVTGVFMTIQSMLSNLRLSKSPKIAIISSQLGSQTIASGGGYIYCASKAALDALTRVMAIELGPHNIRVNTVAPGTVATQRIKASHNDERREAWLRSIPLARYGEPHEIAAAALFLASDDASYITGQTLCVDTTSVNFYQLCSAAVAARPNRKTILSDTANFPTDRYILEGICKQYGAAPPLEWITGTVECEHWEWDQIPF